MREFLTQYQCQKAPQCQNYITVAGQSNSSGSERLFHKVCKRFITGVESNNQVALQSIDCYACNVGE